MMENGSRDHRIAKLEAILARDLIDLTNDYTNDKHVIEFAGNLCFTLMRLFDEVGLKKKAIDWQELFDAYDQKYYALQHSQEPKSNI